MSVDFFLGTPVYFTNKTYCRIFIAYSTSVIPNNLSMEAIHIESDMVRVLDA
jgi:hypothetical protein